MQKHREILRQVCRLMVALAVCVAIMLGVYALLGAYTSSVVVGAILGFVLDRAARDKAPQRAQLSIQASGVIRLLVLAAIYILLFRAKVCDPVAALLPLLMAQAVLKLVEFFRKDDEGGDATV